MINFQLLCLVAFLVIVLVIVRYTTEDAVAEPSPLYFCAFYEGASPRFFLASGWPDAVDEALRGGRELVGISLVRNSADPSLAHDRPEGQNR
jgi:hypothetical protein